MEVRESSVRGEVIRIKMETLCVLLILSCLQSSTAFSSRSDRNCFSRASVMFCDLSANLPHFPLDSDITTLVIGDRLLKSQLERIKTGYDMTVIVKGLEHCEIICDDNSMKNGWKHRCICQVRI